MFKYEAIIQIAEIIRNEYPKESKDFVDAFEWFSLAIDGVLTRVGNQLPEIHKAYDYSKIKELADFSSNLKEMQEQAINLSSYFENQDEYDEELREEEIIESERKVVPNYADYSVDNNVPHTLYEDYKYTKACAFSFRGNIYEAKNMRDVLVQTCAILADIDIEKIKSFINDPAMKGRKVSYFGTEFIAEDFINKNENIPGTNLYVWVNLSCNHIRNIIRKMLKKYGIDFNDFKIFLRADFSELHKDQTIDDNQPPEGVEKIGKHVSNCMRKLSDNKHIFTTNEIIAMQSAQWSKDELGIYEPLIKKYIKDKDIPSQINLNSYPRYWKEIFIFNGEKFFVTSQWYERHRKAFDEWFDLLMEEK